MSEKAKLSFDRAIGRALTFCRCANNMSTLRLASLSGVDDTRLRAIEQGQTTLSAAELNALAAGLNLNSWQILKLAMNLSGYKHPDGKGDPS